MTQEELTQELLDKGFEVMRDEEYHFDIYTNKAYKTKVDDKTVQVSLQIKVNYYNAAMIWWWKENRKCSKFYYNHSELPNFKTFDELVEHFLKYCSDMFRVKIENVE